MKITRLLTNTIGTAMLAGALMLAPQTAQAQAFISVGFAPPAIPIYEQPLCPGDGYIWTPGYWAYTDDGYEWVDGAWVLAPYTGALWTPGYWGYGGSSYFWNAGYWGTSIGYYGGINYGFGYFGSGFYGGYWNGGSFFYNREYNHFNNDRDFRHVYNRHVDGFDGRPGGVSYARTNGNENRGGGFNNGVNRGGFGQTSGLVHQTDQTGRIHDGEVRGIYTSPRSNLGQPLPYNQSRPGSTFNGGSGANSITRPSAPVYNYRPNPGSTYARPNLGGNSVAQPGYLGNSYRPSPGSTYARPNFGGNYNARPAAPVNNYHPSQGSVQRSQPAPSFHGGGGGGGGFHGGGGGGSHGGHR